jgi:formyltetrahydrofolate synthetase
VLDGVTNHKKFIGILSGQASIALRQRKYQEALDITAKLEAIAKEVYGANQTVQQ